MTNACPRRSHSGVGNDGRRDGRGIAAPDFSFQARRAVKRVRKACFLHVDRTREPSNAAWGEKYKRR